MEDIYKEVHFDKFCNKCIHEKKKENESPCDECLEEPIKMYSEIPVRFEEKEGK